jgi:IPT/TIG domain
VSYCKGALRVAFLTALVALACIFLGSASATSPPQPVLHQSGGVIPRTGHHGGAAAAAGALSGHQPANGVVDPTLQVTNHGGIVMTTENMYLVFWQAPGWPSFPSGYTQAVTQWIQDVAADDGKTSNPFGAIMQYGAGYNFHLGGTVLDTTHGPDTANDTGPGLPNFDPTLCDSGSSPCVNEDSLVDEIGNTLVSNSWPHGGLSSQFAIILPPGVSTCDGTDACSVGELNTAFCAYHSYFTDGITSNPYVFLTLPYEPDVSPQGGCHTTDDITPQPEPNGHVDVLISSMSHEMREAATDPTFQGWFDAAGNETDDKCYIDFGSNIGSNYNQLENGHPYDTQLEWSNALKDCFQVGPPAISSFSPASAVAGQSITINGSNFFSAFGSTPTVKFNGIAAASVTVNSPTQLVATVPAGKVAGKITVTGLGGTGTSAGSLGQAPTISGLSVTSGHAGDVVTVTGTALTGASSMKFNGVTASFSAPSSDGTSLKAIVPAAATDGPVTVTTAFGSAISAASFLVLPTITSFTPTSGAAGVTVTINGSGFGAENGVTFTGDGDANGIPVFSSATQIVVQVPTNVKVGPVTVYTHGGTHNTTSTASFSPLPSITGFNHASAMPGDTLIVSGANFTGNGPVSATVNGVTACGPCTATATTVTLTVPNTVTGPVVVTNGDGSATSSASLSVLPRIDSISGSGGAGTTVIVHGAGFNGTTAVSFGDNTEPATFVVGGGGTSLQVKVPTNATTGKIGVTNAGGTTLSASNYTVPTIVSSFAPFSATVGVNMVIQGSGLLGADEVSFVGGVIGVPTAVTSTSLRVVIPPGALTGPISVHTASGWTTPARPLTITFSVTGFSPASAHHGDQVEVDGVGLTGVTAVLFNGVPGTNVTVVSDTEVTVDVPASGAVGGAVTVTKGKTTIPTPGTFTLLP